MSILTPYRVLDLTTERGLLCGQMLADMGADVIKVEPVGGSPARQIGPFYKDQPHPDRSLYWWAYNRNKRSITLDIERDEGRALLRRLVERADFLIESHDPGYLRERKLGFSDLEKINPALIYVSITPFGQDGPKANYADSDLIIMAAGGPLEDVRKSRGLDIACSVESVAFGTSARCKKRSVGKPCRPARLGAMPCGKVRRQYATIPVWATSCEALTWELRARVRHAGSRFCCCSAPATPAFTLRHRPVRRSARRPTSHASSACD